MANYSLRQTGGIDIQTDFRFQIEIRPDSSNSLLGLTENCTAYIQNCTLPHANGEAITWHLPGGMKNYQAGKRTNQECDVEFVIPSTPNEGSWFKILEHWSNACYDMNNGSNIGKANYCSDAIYINLMRENLSIAYRFHMLRAQPTKVDYAKVSSESSGAGELLKVKASFIYDLYELTDGNGTLLATM